MSLRLALIPPISLLHWTYHLDYQLMLPQLLENSQYRRVYHNHCISPNTFVILDNGEAEGVAPDWDVLQKTILQYRPDEFVLPDVIGNGEETMKRAIKWSERFTKPEGVRWMYVLQGRTYEEFLEGAHFARESQWIDTIGIPRHMLATTGDYSARSRLSNEISPWQSAKPIHFLGTSPNHPTEVLRLANFRHTDQSLLRGIDTSAPFNFAHEHVFMNGWRAPVPRPGNYFHLSILQFPLKHVSQNVSDLLQWCDGYSTHEQ